MLTFKLHYHFYIFYYFISMQSKLWNVGLCCHLTVHIAETIECSNLISHRIIPLKRCNGKQTTTAEKYQKPTMKIYSFFMTPHLRFMTQALKYKNMTTHSTVWIHGLQTKSICTKFEFIFEVGRNGHQVILKLPLFI